MKKTVFVGIDFSKLKIDVCYYHKDVSKDIYYEQYENTRKGCLKLINKLKSKFKEESELLFCGEYTGIYSMTLAYVLNKEKLDLWLESPLQLRLSSGITRDKNDKIDSYHIAKYAQRFVDKVKLYQLSSEVLLKIKELVSYKDRLTKVIHQLTLPAKELKRVWFDWDESDYILESTQTICSKLEAQIKDIEKQMLKLLKTDPELKNLYDLIMTVKGVGIQTTIYLLVHTMGFTTFENSRQLACYCGVVPFAKQSGTSLNQKGRVSHIANKKLKTLLHMCALNSIRYDINMHSYYHRKIEEGKHKMKVINNVRNKLVHRIWAVVQKQQPYDMYYQNSIAA